MAKASGTVKTTLRLPRDLWMKAKVRAMEEDRDLQDLIAAAIVAYLKGGGR